MPVDKLCEVRVYNIMLNYISNSLTPTGFLQVHCALCLLTFVLTIENLNMHSEVYLKFHFASKVGNCCINFTGCRKQVIASSR